MDSHREVYHGDARLTAGSPFDTVNCSAGRERIMSSTKFCGCFGMLLSLAGVSFAAELGDRPVTFTKDIAPILQAKCQDCHRTGSMAPMSLVTYEETRPWAKAIKQKVIT